MRAYGASSRSGCRAGTSYEAGAEEYLDAGDGRVLVICWQRGLGPGGHVPVQMDWAQICTLKGGLVCRLEAYSDRHEALKAVGLRLAGQAGYYTF